MKYRADTVEFWLWRGFWITACMFAGLLVGATIKYLEAQSRQAEIIHPQIERVDCEWMNRKASKYAIEAESEASILKAQLSTMFSELYRNCKEFNVTDSK